MITSSQTVGPFFGPAILRDGRVAIGGEGESIRIEGRVLDGDGAPVPDALLEFWQADARGRYAAEGFVGFARVATDDGGAYTLATIRPGPVGGMARHLAVTIFARGLLSHLETRLFFADDPLVPADPVLARVPANRRATLLARPEDGRYRWDVILQGDATRETVFFRWLTS
ncbi:MAG: protocatechuate 3,4-dioxygenase subunit alpha [Chloroflexi bacterium]|nr:protocatechuate 3,4-dioxygenase subunit alpha [Chloroflexota bacterium]